MKAIKWLFISVFVLAGLVAGGYFGFGSLVAWSSKGDGIDGGAGSWVMRSLFHDGPRYYELAVKLMVEDQPVEITRVIECKPYFAHRLGDYFQKRWYAEQETMTQRMPDSSGVIIVVPKLCEEFAHPQPADAPPWGAFPALPEDFVPLILWTADADNPDVMEGYHSFESLSRAGSRVRFTEAELRNSENLEPKNYLEEFGVMRNAHFGGLRGGDRDRRPTSNYRGYYLTTLDESEWSKVPELRVALSGVSESGFLRAATWRKVVRNFRMQSGFDQYAIAGSLVTRHLGARSGAYASEFTVLDEMHGIELRDDVVTFSAERQGIATYMRDDLRIQFTEGKSEKMKLQINNKKILWPQKNMDSFYYYDADRRRIYHLNVVFSYFEHIANTN